MEKIVTIAYKAEDGEVFKTAEECREHEGSIGTAEFYDCNGERYPISKHNLKDFDVWDYDFGHCHAVHITSSRCTIKNNSETETWEKGWYFFDYGHDEWFKVPEPYDGWIKP